MKETITNPPKPTTIIETKTMTTQTDMEAKGGKRAFVLSEKEIEKIYLYSTQGTIKLVVKNESGPYE